MMERDEIRFVLNGREERLAGVHARETLLDFLRLRRRLTGTKEGCAEGDCGACTVLVGRRTGEGGGLRYEPVNACIRFLASVDGCHVVTVEHLRGGDGGLAPVQRAMVEQHASQCGFCTPGIVMALHALWLEDPRPAAARIETALQGNLCRCTGYAPIVQAAQMAADHGMPDADPLITGGAAMAARLDALHDGARVRLADGWLPATVDDFATLYDAHPEATVIAGATDVGLWVTKELRDVAPALFIGHLAELRGVEDRDGAIRIGAAASYEEAGPALCAAYPHLAEYWDRIGGWQVRAAGTIGGNIANGSPIGDTPPALIALGARLVLRRGAERREIALERFFIDYGRQDRAPGEFVEAVIIPQPAEGVLHAAWKISKRRDEDISAVAAGIAVTVAQGRITDARLAFGGMAATPRRAAAAEAALAGRDFDAAAFEAAAAALADDFAPISDWRASAGYRMRVAQNLLRRFWRAHGAGERVRLPRRGAA